MNVFLLATFLVSAQAIALLKYVSCPFGADGLCGTMAKMECAANATCRFRNKKITDDAGLCCIDPIPRGFKFGTCPDSNLLECSSGSDECAEDYDCPRQKKCCDNACGVKMCTGVLKKCRYGGETYASGDNFASLNFGCDDCYCHDGETRCTHRTCVMAE